MSYVHEVAKSNDYPEKLVKNVDDRQSKKDLEDFKNYYENASYEKKKELDKKFITYLDEELQKDSDLKNRLNNSEIKESSEISEQDIANLNTVRNLTDVLNDYPNINNPEYRAIKKMVAEYIDEISEATKKVFSNLEDVE